MTARGIPEACELRIDAFYQAGQQVVDVAFPPAGGDRWVVAASAGYYAKGVDDECYQMMRNLTQGGRRITRVAFPAPAAGRSWPRTSSTPAASPTPASTA
ncbi:hypothetical protein ACFQ0B_24665 [Nonomuraea thailandensis]